jgi:alpha-galactosidase
VSEASTAVKQHPDWVLKRPDGTPAKMWDNTSWGGAIYSLDVTLPAVRTWLLELFRKVTREWGYDYVKIDFLYYPLEAGTAPAGDMPPVAAYRAALKAIRAGCGPRTYILGCGAPIGPTVGLVNGNRIGPDVGTAWRGVVEAARNTAAREWMNGVWWHNDPDATVLREPLTPDQARAWSTAVALSGGLVMLTDNLETLDETRKRMVRSIMPVSAKRTRIADLWTGAKEPASVWILPSSVSPANITVAALFNWTDAAKTVAVDPRALGVIRKPGRVHVWDIAGAKYLGFTDVVVEIPPTSCRLLALTPDAGHPQLLGTDAHVTSGAKDVVGVSWLSAYKALRCRMRATPGRPFQIAVTEPARLAFRTVEAKGGIVERMPSEPGSVMFRVMLTGPHVRLVIRYR